MTLHRSGSHDDSPDEIDLPGIDAKLSPKQREAVKALKKFHKIKKENKQARKEMKILEDQAAEEAFAALDEIKAETGTLGTATFFTEWKRKLTVEIQERRSREQDA
jgi:hypothetical protein